MSCVTTKNNQCDLEFDKVRLVSIKWQSFQMIVWFKDNSWNTCWHLADIVNCNEHQIRNCLSIGEMLLRHALAVFVVWSDTPRSLEMERERNILIHPGTYWTPVLSSCVSNCSSLHIMLQAHWAGVESGQNANIVTVSASALYRRRRPV